MKLNRDFFMVRVPSTQGLIRICIFMCLGCLLTLGIQWLMFQAESEELPPNVKIECFALTAAAQAAPVKSQEFGVCSEGNNAFVGFGDEFSIRKATKIFMGECAKLTTQEKEIKYISDVTAGKVCFLWTKPEGEKW